MSNPRFRGNKRRGRTSRRLLSKPLVLIVCEGEKTEPNYLHGLRKRRKINRDRIRIFNSKDCDGTDPKTIVECAKRKKRNLKRDEELNYDKVWCVFDRDIHTTFDQALNQAQANNINVAFSNPCIELWFLLHFQDQTAHIDRISVERELRKIANLPAYKKGMQDLYGRLLSRQSSALKRAANLRQMHKRNYNVETTNPSTSLDLLINFLNTM
ncbi:MAG: RloB domain-containing protein [Deltaproteobacteria bacterium]|nr:RloB domain-containing protein [Deltaproteobacteria bacterium]